MNTMEIWKNRYQNGGNSGSGSYNELYIFKRDIINDIINKNDIQSIIDFGCGDGNQIKEINTKNYIGIDIADTSIKICKMKYNNDNTKKFYTYDEIDNIKLQSDLTMSLDVLYHILEEDLYFNYLKNLFSCSSNYVLIYSNNYNGHIEGHIYTRKFTDNVENMFPNWELHEKINQKYPKKSSADFYLYKKK